ncbi:MAG: polyprenyl synthetase family protein [Bacteroidota bacterium]
MSLDTIKQPVSEELLIFEGKFREAVQSNVPLLDKVTWYIVQRKGKQVRPMITLLSAKIFGSVNEASYTAAALIELIHTATLVHDDVVDDANMRRGFFSINALWKNKVAVLVGDFLLSQALLLTVRQKQYKMLEVINSAVREMAEGELLQMEKARRLDIEESVYYEIIRQKTASLIAAACCAGAVSTVDGNEELEARMKLFGEKMGMAFQIKDDLFDFGDDDVGKPLGIDIKEKKMTLPLIYALNNAGWLERRRIINIVKNQSHKSEKVAEVIRFVRESGGIEYTRQAMYRFRQEAFDILDTLPDNPSREAMRELLVYVTERKK